MSNTNTSGEAHALALANPAPLDPPLLSTLLSSSLAFLTRHERPTCACVCLPQDPSGEAASEAQKHLTMYELDLGLNHVVRKYSEPIDNGANMLIPVPGAGDGPGAWWWGMGRGEGWGGREEGGGMGRAGSWWDGVHYASADSWS